MARWLNSAQNRITFLSNLAPEAQIKTRPFPLVIQFIPLHFGPERSEEVHHIELTNNLSPGTIVSA